MAVVHPGDRLLGLHSFLEADVSWRRLRGGCKGKRQQQDKNDVPESFPARTSGVNRNNGASNTV
jgi:hypothetical protein